MYYTNSFKFANNVFYLRFLSQCCIGKFGFLLIATKKYEYEKKDNLPFSIKNSRNKSFQVSIAINSVNTLRCKLYKKAYFLTD